MSVILKEESGQFTLSITFESAESLESFSEIYTEEYFEVLGLLEKAAADVDSPAVFGGDSSKPVYVNQFFADLYNQFAPLFRYDAKELMSTKPPVKKPLSEEDSVPPFTTQVVPEAVSPPLQEDSTQVVEEAVSPPFTTQVVEDKEVSPPFTTQVVEEAVFPPLLKWEMKLTKKWETLVLTETEFIEMKKNNIKSDNLEQDKDGLTRPEKVYLEKMEKIQFSYKKSLQKTNLIDFSVLPEIIPSAFYIWPRDSPFYIRLSFRHL